MSSSIIASVITGGTNSHQTVAEELNTYATDFVTPGVVGTISSGPPMTGSFGATQDASPDLGVTFIAGQAYVQGTPSGQDSQVVRARMTANYTSYTINSNSSGSTKYDWIYLQLNATNASTPDSAADNVINLYTSRSSSNSSDNGSPPTYGLLLCVVTVANGAPSITNSNITDKRVQAVVGPATSQTAVTGWQSLAYAFTYASNAGNKEFTVSTPNNLTGVLSAGMKYSVARSVTPPTQSMVFVSASSQYGTASSPAGLTFTSAFTIEAWVYPTNYVAGGLITRDDGTNGWGTDINANGQLEWYYRSSGLTQFQTVQSIPLNAWTHIALVVSSTSSKTAVAYINGQSVSFTTPSSVATALTQGTAALQVGKLGATSNYYGGYLSEVRVWSVAQTQASIQGNMAISVSGASSNLVALFQGNGNFNDGTSNANNLTATNGALATQASNPYNATEYAVINSISYSAPNTTLTLDTGLSCTIPNQTLNTPQYSTSESPFGITAGLEKNRTLALIFITTSITNTATSATQVPGLTATVTVPTGGSNVRISLQAILANSSSSVQPALTVWSGTVGSGNQIAQLNIPPSSINGSAEGGITLPLAAGSYTFNVGMHGSGAGTNSLLGNPAYPSQFKVELVS